MSNRSNPIGKTAAAVIQTAPAKKSVITTLASAILSNYGKILLLLGTACLIGYAVTYRKSSGQQDDEASSDLPKEVAPTAAEINTDQTSSGQQDLEPSSDLPEENRLEAREIIREVARHKAVLAPLVEKIPGLSEQIQQNLASSDINDLRGCLALLQGPKEINFIAAIKLGANSWILSKGNKEDHCITLIFDESETHFMSVNNQIAQAILAQAGVSEEELKLSPENAWLTLSINNLQLTKIEGYETKPLSIEFIHAPKMLT